MMTIRPRIPLCGILRLALFLMTTMALVVSRTSYKYRYVQRLNPKQANWLKTLQTTTRRSRRTEGTMSASTTPTNGNDSNNNNVISTIIFDVDDTLYDVSCGFTKHRNGEIVQQYMVDHLKFNTLQEAKAVRDEYFVKYHATAKALTVAQQEGKFPKDAPIFDTKHLAEYWANNLDYTKLGTPKTIEFINTLKTLQSDSGITLVAFSNGPRAYVKRVLQYIGMFDLFGEERLYAVDDVLPYCKPEPEAFQKIFNNIGCTAPETCVMVEDSMKNIRAAKQLGMKTLLVTGKQIDESSNGDNRILPDDCPLTSDPNVDCSIPVIEDITKVLPGLWINKADDDNGNSNAKPIFNPIIV